jgi:hypothetical protein
MCLEVSFFLRAHINFTHSTTPGHTTQMARLFPLSKAKLQILNPVQELTGRSSRSVSPFFLSQLFTSEIVKQIEDLFYNIPTRQSSLRSPSEEYARILDVMTKYAVHNPKVAFMCKKVSPYLSLLLSSSYSPTSLQVGSSGPDLSTSSGSSTLLAIRQLYGPTIHKHLLELTVESEDHPRRRRSSDSDAGHDAEFWSAEAHFTSASYQSKKMVFLLFINRRSISTSLPCLPLISST